MNKPDLYNKNAAEEYDERAKVHLWSGPDIVFGLTYEYMSRDEKILDIGIGTGLSSLLFKKAGLKIYGFDGSPQILDVCASKGFASELKLHDLNKIPFPYDDSCFDHVLSIGVFELFKDLSPIFKEIARIIKPKGIFAFTAEDEKETDVSEYTHFSKSCQVDLSLFRHSLVHTGKMLDESGFKLLKHTGFQALREDTAISRAYVAQRLEK